MQMLVDFRCFFSPLHTLSVSIEFFDYIFPLFICIDKNNKGIPFFFRFSVFPFFFCLPGQIERNGGHLFIRRTRLVKIRRSDAGHTTTTAFRIARYARCVRRFSKVKFKKKEEKKKVVHVLRGFHGDAVKI